VSSRPRKSILRAFGVSDDPNRLSGDTWATSAVVFKRLDDEAEATWLAEFASGVKQNGFRLASPLRRVDGGWFAEGWCAWTRVAGEHRSDRWPETLAAADAFHRIIAGTARPEFIDRRSDRWRVADRVAWEEIPVTEFAGVTHVPELVSARRPISLPSQLIHGDLVGNVLFADGLAPAIIDLSLYWRPAGYGAALVVANAIAWEGAPHSTVELLRVIPEWPQLLVRAALFRVIVSELARRAMPWREQIPNYYRPLVELALSFAPEA
jgi:uncharacterized protein (TIGR02569 family)